MRVKLPANFSRSRSAIRLGLILGFWGSISISRPSISALFKVGELGEYRRAGTDHQILLLLGAGTELYLRDGGSQKEGGNGFHRRVGRFFALSADLAF